MHLTHRLAALLVYLLAARGVSAAGQPTLPRVIDAQPAQKWNARFQGEAGWIGGDCVYTVALPGNRVLWLFGDTLIGNVNGAARTQCVLVNNSIAISAGLAPDAPLRFISGSPQQGRPTAFWLPPDGNGWFWPQGAVMANDRLLLFMAQTARVRGGGAFGFSQFSQCLLVVDNPRDEPERWRPAPRPLPFAQFLPKSERSFGSAALVEGSWLYVYGYRQGERGSGNRQLLLARAPVASPDDFSRWEFKSAAGWSSQPDDAQGLAEGLATEFSVTACARPPGFLLVYTPGGLSGKIAARYAPSPEGPWSAPVTLFTAPEMGRDKGLFTYAAKAHPWANAGGDRLLISYCVNAWEFSRVLRDQSVYRPRFVDVQLAP